MDGNNHGNRGTRLRRSFRRILGKKDLEAGPANNTLPINNNDHPIPKRKGSIKKWLTSPVRKLSTKQLERIDGSKGRKLHDDLAVTQHIGDEANEEEPLKEDPPLAAGEDLLEDERVSAVSQEDLLAPRSSPTTVPPESPVDDEDNLEPIEAVPLPPPMELQNHSTLITRTTSSEKEDGRESLLSLGPTPDVAGMGPDPVTEIEQLVSQKREDEKEVDTTKEVAKTNGEASEADKEGQPGPAEDEDDVGKADLSLGDLEQTVSPPSDDEGDTEAQQEEAKKEAALNKRSYIMAEIQETEKDYVKDLGKCVEEYIVHLKDENVQKPEGLEEGKIKIVFGNIHQIYDWHKETFSIEIAKCFESPELLGGLFKKYERRLQMYVVYCQNKPKSEFIVSEYEAFFEEVRVKLGHKLSLADLLIKPVQRIMKYQLLLKDFLKQTKKAGLDTETLETAVQIMCVVPKRANDMMAISRLQGFDGKITAQGKLLRQGTLSITENVSNLKFKERRVFMFEQIIIFSEPLEKKKGSFNNPGYIFKKSMKVNTLSIQDIEDDTLQFKLIERGGEKFLIQTQTPEEKSTWFQEIRDLLNQQQDFLRALQSPIQYQKGLDSTDKKGPEQAPPAKTSTASSMFSKLRKSNSQTSDQPASSLQKQHALFSSLKSHRKNQTAPAAISLAELKDKEKAAKKKPLTGQPEEPTSPPALAPQPEDKTEKDGLKTSNHKNSCEKENQQSGSPSLRKKFFDGLFHSFRPSKSRDTSPMGSKESLKGGKETGSSKESIDKNSNKSSPLSSNADLAGASPLEQESDAQRNSKSPLKRTQSARDSVPSKSSQGGSTGSLTLPKSGSPPPPLDTTPSPVGLTAPPPNREGVTPRSKRASTGSIQKDQELCSSGNRKVSLDSSPYRSRNAVENRAMEASGVTQNRLSYTSVSSAEGDDTFVESTCMSPIISSYTAVKEDEITVAKGDMVQILAANQHNMYLVHRASSQHSPAAEGWLPGHVLGNTKELLGDPGSSPTQANPASATNSETTPKKTSSWHEAFRIRRSGQRSDRKEKHLTPKMRSGSDGSIDSNRGGREKESKGSKIATKLLYPHFVYESAPEFTTPLTNQTVNEGDDLILACQVCGKPTPTITWEAPPTSAPLRADHRVRMMERENGMARLEIADIRSEEKGEYTCIAFNAVGSQTCSALVSVRGKPKPPSNLTVHDVRATSVVIKWDVPQRTRHSPIIAYTVEYALQGMKTLKWEIAAAYVTDLFFRVDDLNPGSSYYFRVSANNDVGISLPSEACEVATLASDLETESDYGSGALWQHGFQNAFNIIGELERGRFSVVKMCYDKQTQREVAAKCISKKLRSVELVENEVAILGSLSHPSVYRLLGCYQRHQHLVLILDLIPNGRLLEHLISLPIVTEPHVAAYVAQILEILVYLHGRGIAHLDIKPENFMVDMTSMSPTVKLIDFGDAAYIGDQPYVHVLLGSPEFSPPELVNRACASLKSDIWSVGVLTYVLLSGVSPFLDETVEETCQNITRVDFSFPEEFFKTVGRQAKVFICNLLKENPSDRPCAEDCLHIDWLRSVSSGDSPMQTPTLQLDTSRLVDFIERRKTQNDIVPVTPVAGHQSRGKTSTV
ncbi:triple functional domain protein-like isoform X2 [Patiria miniata]|uniref:Non-specific serine/threonine protein kinase n=1 Tax=Patiria miniata TaxID=46514 RepID=A0A914B7L3_PATMI|nr:triple functional domain protein-like isoform X2 [Patiria miniata]